MDRHREPLDAAADARLLRVRVLPGTAPGGGDPARIRHALPGRPATSSTRSGRSIRLSPPVPSPSDIAYLGFYVSVAAAVVWLARRDTGSFPRALWLDGAIGAAGAAAALETGLSFLHSGDRGDSAAVIVGGAYTVADLLLVAMIAGLLTVRGVRGGTIWVWLAAGMATFCAADVVYAVRVDAGIYAAGPWLYLLWMTGITSIARVDLVAAAVTWRSAAPDRGRARDPDARDAHLRRDPRALRRSARTRS